MKSISLLPVYQHKANTYAALSNPLYDEDIATYSKENGQENYYHYLLTVGKNKNLDKSIFQGLEDAEDKLTKLYGATLADSKERKEWDLQITDPTDTSKTKNFVGTEVEYLDKIIELKREYKKYEQDRAMEQAEKDAMNGWQKAGTGFISFMGNLAVGFEQFLAGTAEFLAGGATWLYHGLTGQGFDKENYKDIGLTEAVDKQAEGLADFERRYTDFRDIYGNLTTGGKVATTIAQGIGQQLPALVANIFLPGSGYAALYAGSAAGSLNQYITESEVPVWQAAIKVAISTGFEIGIERGLGKLWGRTGGDIAKYGKAAENVRIRDLAKSLTGKEGAKILGKTILRGTKDIAQESLEEFLQEWSNVAVDFISSKINTGFESDIKDLLTKDGNLDISKAFERTLYAGLAGAAGSAFFGGIGKIRYEKSVSKGLKQTTGYDSSLFDKEYVVEENGNIRKLNFFEKIALQTNIRGIFERIQLAQNGALSQEARTEIWENTLMLGDFFNSLSKEDLDASLKLFNEIHNYAEEQGKKLRTIEEFKKGSLIAKVPNNAKSEFFTKDDSVEIAEKEKDKFYSGEMDLTFGAGLLQQLYGARNITREKGLKESPDPKTKKKAEKAIETSSPANQKLKESLTDEETKQQLADDLVTEVNPLIEALEEIENLENATAKKSFLTLNDEIEKGGRKAYLTNGDKIITDKSAVYIPNKVLTNPNGDFIIEQITEEDIINKCVETYLAPIEVGVNKKATKYEKDQYKLFAKMKDAFFSQFSNLKPNKGESDNHFFVRMLFTDIGPYSAIKYLLPSEYKKGIQLILTAVVGLEKELGKFGDAYQKRGHKIFESFQKAAINWLTQNFATYYRSTEVVYANPLDFTNLLNPDQVQYIIQQRKNIPLYADGKSFVSQTKVENPQVMTLEDSKIQLKTMGSKDRFALDILGVVEGKKRYGDLAQDNPVRSFWKNPQEENAGLDMLIASNKTGNETYPRASKTIIENATKEQVEILAKTTLGYTNIVPGYLVSYSSNKEQATTNGYTIVIQNFKHDDRYYAPIVNEKGEARYVYARDQRYEVVEHDEKNKRIVIVPKEEFISEEAVGFETTKESLSLWPETYEILDESKSWTFPRFTKTSFPFIKGKETSLADLLRSDLSQMTKERITVTDMINYPGDLLNEDFKAKIGILTKANVYQAIQNYLLDNSEGRLSLATDRSGNSYYVGNIAPVYDFMAEEAVDWLTEDFDGYSLAEDFSKKIEEDVNYYKIKDFFPKLAKKFPAIGEVKIYLNLLGYAGNAYGATTPGLEYIEREANDKKGDLSKKPLENKTVREPKIEINFQYSDNSALGRTPNGHLMFIVAHEVQHILQEQFGWVWGANPGLQVPQSVKNFILNTKAYKDQYEAYLKDFGPNGAAGDSEKAFQIVVYINNIGEIQANLDTPARNGLGFVTMIEPNGKVNVITPDGRMHYANHIDQDEVTKTVPVSSFVDAAWWESLDPSERKQSRSTTQLKRTNELYKKYYADKRKRLDKRVQGFLEDVKNEEGLNKLPRDLAALIREDAATYDDFISWFKQAKDIDEDTFKLFVDNIFPGTEIKSFKELEELTLKLGYALDEEGNLQLDSKGNPKENVYRNRGQTFSPDFDKYRAALMQYYDPSLGLKGMQKYVRQAEFLGRQITASDIKVDEEDKREFGDTEQTTNTLEDQIYGERQRLETQVAKYVALKEKEKYKNGEITEEQLNKKLVKLRPNKDGDIELFDKFSDAQLKTMYKQLVAQETKNLGGIEAAENKITQAEAAREKKSNNQLDTEKATRRGLRKIAEILGLMTDEEIKDLIGDDAKYFHRDENGKLVYHVTGRWSLTEDVQSARENLLNRLRGHVEEWRAKQKGRKEAFRQAQVVKQKQKALEEQKKKVEVTTVEPDKVAPVNQISLKAGDKLIKFKSTTNQIPSTLQKIFNNVFDKNNLENSKEEHYSNENMREFMKSNGNLIIDMTPQDWFSVLEFFEQSEVEGDTPEANIFRATRLYTLFSMVILMKTGRTVMNKDYINRANNLMKKPSMTTKESNAWNNLMLRTQGKNIVAQTHSFIPTKVQEEFETAMVTSVDGSDENFANAVVHLKQAIVEEAEEAKKKKTKAQSIWDKVLSFRYTAMLSSPMTWFRNAFSNRVVRRMNGWAEKIGNALTKWSWVGEKIPVDKFTEKIIGFENKTEFDETVKVPIIGKKQGDYILVGTKVKKSVAQWIQDNLVKNGLLHELTQGYSKYDPDKRMKDLSGVNYIVETMVDNYRKQYNLEHTFDTEFLNKFHKFVTRMISDEKFINEATLKYFGKMLTEDIDKGRLDETELQRSDLLDNKISEIFAKAQWLAFTDYMRNGNFVTKWLSELSKGDNFFAKYAIPLVAPFAQSSVNWWVETMRYSPFGLGKAIINLVKYDKYIKKMDERRQVRGEIATPEGFDRYLLVRNLGKGVLGTILWSIGFMLSAMGIAGLNKKGDKYVLKIGDKVELDISKYFNSSSVIAGIATLDSIKNVATGKTKDWTSIFSNVLNAYGETLFLSDLLGEYQYHDGLGGYIKDLPYNFIYSMVPNIMKLTASVTHVGKTNYDSGFVGKIQRLLAGIPGMPYLLDQWAGVEVNPYTGEKYKGWGLVENTFKQFGFGNTGMNYFGISEVEREAVKHNISLNNLTGNIKVGDKEYKFNKNNMNEKAGHYVNQLVTQLLDGEILYKNKTYGKMTSEEQKEAMRHYINKAREYAKIDVWTSNGHKYYASQEMYNTLKNLGIGNVYLGSKGYVE